MPNYTHVWNTHQIVSRLHIEHCSTKFEQNAVLSWILEKMDKTKSKHTGTQNKKIVVKSMKLQNGYHIPATHTHCAQENLHNSRAHNWSLIRSHAYKTKMHHVFHTNEMKRRERTNFQFPVYPMNFSIAEQSKESSLPVRVCDVRTYCVHWR